ncbi:hypothetical protein C8J57DRAFT_1528782 [Mycena rebaudengoi]|nr:hypothetical protein C8J57DRAFT_1528782 [Mycena rebaudengoi]
MKNRPKNCAACRRWLLPQTRHSPPLATSGWQAVRQKELDFCDWELNELMKLYDPGPSSTPTIDASWPWQQPQRSPRRGPYHAKNMGPVFMVYTPDLHRYYTSTFDTLLNWDVAQDHLKYLRRNFAVATSTFTTATFNFGPRTATFPHIDFGNSSPPQSYAMHENAASKIAQLGGGKASPVYTISASHHHLLYDNLDLRPQAWHLTTGIALIASTAKQLKKCSCTAAQLRAMKTYRDKDPDGHRRKARERMAWSVPSCRHRMKSEGAVDVAAKSSHKRYREAHHAELAQAQRVQHSVVLVDKCGQDSWHHAEAPPPDATPPPPNANCYQVYYSVDRRGWMEEQILFDWLDNHDLTTAPDYVPQLHEERYFQRGKARWG